jgi:E3 ubiquitin-protein ligase HUWE1
MLAGLGGALGGMVLPPPVATGPAVADETRIAQLMDMGFPRSAASSALLRCRNNLAIATEYLLSRPDMVGAARIADALAAPAEEVAAVVDAPAAAAAPVPVDAPADIVMEGVAPVAVPAEEPAAPAAPEPVVAAVQDVEMESAAAVDKQANEEASEAKDAANKLALTTLDAARDLLKPTFLSRAISLAEDYPDLVFDVKSAFSLFSPAGDGPTLQPILDDLDRVDGSATSDKEEQAIATRLRIIALLATDTTYRETIEKAREELMQILVRYAALYAASRPAKESRPKWLASVMLVADTLFSLGNAPTSTTILEEGVELPLLENTSQGPRWTDEREQFYQVAMHVLVAGISDRETFMSTLRLLFVLTRDESIARQFVEADGLKELFGSFTVERPETEGCRSYAVMILRHVIEEKSVLLPMMEREIEAWFAQPRAKVADMVSFLRGASATAFRNVPIFLEAAQATCKLVQADAAGHYHIALLNEPQPSLKAVELANTIKSPFEGDVAGDAPTEESTVVKPPPKVVSTIATPSASTDAAVHFLMTEILTTSKLAIAPSAVVVATKDGEPIAPSEPAPLAADAATDAPAKAVVDTAAEVPMGDFFHTSFAMSCLTELLSSYSGCKTSFLTFSTKKASKEPSSGTPHKSKSSFLYFLLNDLLALGTLLTPHDFDSRRKASISTWASLIIVALCYDTESSHSSNKDTGSDIGPVRKTVLDAIAKAFKEIAVSSETTDVRYGRLFALSDLCYRLLTARPYPSISKPSDETSMQLAKLMLEKNFAVILTNALADVDLNFPAVNNLINSILRPLEQLTKVVTKVGRSKTSLPSAGRPEDDDSTDGSSMDEGEEFEADTDEEEAPDLYRNSALGMYEGELEPGHQEDAYMSNGSTEEYDEDDDLMEMEDGVIPGSDISDASDVSLIPSCGCIADVYESRRTRRKPLHSPKRWACPTTNTTATRTTRTSQAGPRSRLTTKGTRSSSWTASLATTRMEKTVG